MSTPKGGPGSSSRVFLGVLLGANVPGLILFLPELILGDNSTLVPFALIFLILPIFFISLLVTILFLMPLYLFLSRRLARLYWSQSLLIGGAMLSQFYIGLTIPTALRCRDGSTFISNGETLCDDGSLTVGFALNHGIILLGAFVLGAMSGLVGWLLAFGPRKIVTMSMPERQDDGRSSQ
ncbi:MAG: hypothetical protein OEN23_06870 [Paracoccaceae bacterium]|nr:hypothetical protein [Paracoccaceae bacterium]